MGNWLDWAALTDEEFKAQVLKPVLAEARKRRFTLMLDPFGIYKEPVSRNRYNYSHHLNRDFQTPLPQAGAQNPQNPLPPPSDPHLSGE